MSNIIAQLIYRIEQLERKQANLVREGRVTQRDPAKGIKVAIADVDGKPVETPWIRPSEQAGAFSTFALPSIGQHMKLISPDGEIGKNTMAVPHSYTDQYGQPSQEADEPIWKKGNAELRIKDGQITVKVGGNGFVLTEASLQMLGTFKAKNGSRPAHYVGGLDTDGDAAVDGNADMLV